MTEIVDTLDTSLDVVPDPTASEVHPRLAQRALVPGSLNGTIQVGPPGQDGTDGANGIGVPPGGLLGQVLAKVDDDDYDTEWVDPPAGGGGGSVGQEGPPITGSVTVSPNTFYLINLAANLGNVVITMPSAPEQGTVVEFVRQDTNIFTSTARVTAGAGDNIGDTSPYIISMRRVLILFTYWDTTWWPTVPVGGASGLNGATPSSAFAPTIMSRDNFGRSQVEDPVAAKDIVNLEYLQAHGGSGGGSDEVAIRPDDPTTPEPTAELWVDTDDTTGGLLGLPQSPIPTTDLNTATAPGFYWIPSTGANQPITSRAYHVWTYAASDTPTNVVQVAARATAGITNLSNEMWQRTGSGGAWSPWVPIRYDTGWKTLPIASSYQAYAGTPAPAYRIKNEVVYYRGQIGKIDGSAFGATAFTAVTALPAEAQPTLQSGGYVMTALATSSGSIGGRMYIAAGNPAAILINMEATGALYIDIGTFFYPLN